MSSLDLAAKAKAIAATGGGRSTAGPKQTPSPDRCSRCDGDRDLIRSYWGDLLCAHCAQVTAAECDRDGWPERPQIEGGGDENAEPLRRALGREAAPPLSSPGEGGGAVAPSEPSPQRATYNKGTTKAGISTRRQRRNYSERRSAILGIPADAAAMLDRWGDLDRLYLVGDVPGVGVDGLRSWAMPERLPDGWEHGRHYLEMPNPVLRYVQGGREVEVLRVASWLGEADYTVKEAAQAMRLVRAELEARFDEGRMLSTPATTGRYLIGRTVPFSSGWPVLTDELQDLIRSTSGQGRIELLPRSGELPGLYEYDGRLMYAALCWGLSGGAPVRDTADEYAGYTRGRYRVRFTVPGDWDERCDPKCGMPGHAGIGLLGVTDDDDGWRFPSSPGETGETWCDGAELHVALAHGWKVEIRERLLWPDTPTRGPLDTWAERLVAARQAAEEAAETPAVAALARNAVRAVILHGIGALHGRPHKVSRAVPIDHGDAVPLDVLDTVRPEGDWLLWTEGSDQAWPEMSHPEWSAAIWARARARLLSGPTGIAAMRSGALHVWPQHVVAFRTDALYLDRDPCWPDDGKPGRYRLKRAVTDPVAAPQDWHELLTTRAKGERP